MWFINNGIRKKLEMMQQSTIEADTNKIPIYENRFL